MVPEDDAGIAGDALHAWRNPQVWRGMDGPMPSSCGRSCPRAIGKLSRKALFAEEPAEA